jgi:predicted metal-binding protein
LQEIAAVTEQKAKSLGFTGSEGFAAGSCKLSFCKNDDHCQVLHGNGECRHPDSARPSMSGFGVDVGKLMKSVGWSSTFLKNTGQQEDKMAWVAALVMLR